MVSIPFDKIPDIRNSELPPVVPTTSSSDSFARHLQAPSRTTTQESRPAETQHGRDDTVESPTEQQSEDRGENSVAENVTSDREQPVDDDFNSTADASSTADTANESDEDADSSVAGDAPAAAAEVPEETAAVDLVPVVAGESDESASPVTEKAETGNVSFEKTKSAKPALADDAVEPAGKQPATDEGSATAEKSTAAGGVSPDAGEEPAVAARVVEDARRPTRSRRQEKAANGEQAAPRKVVAADEESLVDGNGKQGTEIATEKQLQADAADQQAVSTTAPETAATTPAAARTGLQKNKGPSADGRTTPATEKRDGKVPAKAAGNLTTASPAAESESESGEATLELQPNSGPLDAESAPKTEATPPVAATAKPTHASQRIPSGLFAKGESHGTGRPLDDAQQARFVHRVMRAFERTEGGGELRLRLNPPELGAMRLQVRVENGGLTAHLETETVQARTALLDSLPVLRERLAEQGIHIEQFDIDLMDRHRDNVPDGQADEGDRDRSAYSNESSSGEGSEAEDNGTVSINADGKLNIVI